MYSYESALIVSLALILFYVNSRLSCLGTFAQRIAADAANFGQCGEGNARLITLSGSVKQSVQATLELHAY